MQITLKTYIIGGAAIALFTAGWLTSSWKQDSMQLAIDRAVSATRDASDLSTAQALADIAVTNKTIYQNVIERTRTETVYRDCRHSPDAFDLITKAFQ